MATIQPERGERRPAGGRWVCSARETSLCSHVALVSFFRLRYLSFIGQRVVASYSGVGGLNYQYNTLVRTRDQG